MVFKIAIIGVGEVGATTAYALVLNRLCLDILLVDPRSTHRDGQVKDLNNAAFNRPGTRVYAATAQEAAQADIIVMTAAVKRKLGETTMQYLHRSTAIITHIVDTMRPIREDSIFVIVSTPVDELATVLQKITGFAPGRVIGTGTALDSARLQEMLAKHFGVSASAVSAMVLGKHGDDQVVPWGAIQIGGVPIDDLPASTSINKTKMEDDCKQEGFLTVQEKGSVAFGIASIVSAMCTSILLDQRQVYPVSHVQKDVGCALSMPAVLGRTGIEKTLPISLSQAQIHRLQISVDDIQDTLQKLAH